MHLLVVGMDGTVQRQGLPRQNLARQALCSM